MLKINIQNKTYKKLENTYEENSYKKLEKYMEMENPYKQMENAKEDLGNLPLAENPFKKKL